VDLQPTTRGSRNRHQRSLVGTGSPTVEGREGAGAGVARLGGLPRGDSGTRGRRADRHAGTGCRGQCMVAAVLRPGARRSVGGPEPRPRRVVVRPVSIETHFPPGDGRSSGRGGVPDSVPLRNLIGRSLRNTSAPVPGGPAAFPVGVRSADAFARTGSACGTDGNNRCHPPGDSSRGATTFRRTRRGWPRSAPSPWSYGRTMRNPSPSVDQLSRALRVVADLATGVGPEQWAA
jgi:hypothetical protein